MASRALRRRTTYRAINGHRQVSSHAVLRVLVVLLVGFTMLTSGASAATIFFYGQNLPSMKNFQSRFEFQNTVIRDWDGHVLYNLADVEKKGHGRRVIEPLQWPGHPTTYYRQHNQDWLVAPAPQAHGIPLILQQATIATEDASFFNNPGFDPLSMARAEYENLTKGYIVSGGSTITQQLVRNYMLDPNQKTLTRKTIEIILAAELTQKYAKSKILWYYLNSVPYGNLAYGAQAASQTYFHKPVWKLGLAESAFLAGLPEAPSSYNPVNNLPAALARMRYVLHLMYIHGYLRDAHNRSDPTRIDRAMNYFTSHYKRFSPPVTSRKYPHFVEYAVEQLQALSQKVPALRGKLYNGLDVTTTIEPQLQDAAQQIVHDQINGLGAYNVTDGALVSMDLRPSCYGCIRAMVGSAGVDAASAAINMANRPRQPGSSFKPFNYIYGFTHGLAPGTTVLDGPLAIPDPGNPDDGGWYEPTDYDHTWHGVVSLRVALDNSLNIPAVKVEQYNASTSDLGLKAIEGLAIKMGLTSMDADNPHCCGWSLTLGGLEEGTRLVEETSAYGTFATGGQTVPPVAIWQVKDRVTGKVLYSAQQAEKNGALQPQQIVQPQYAYLMNNVLSDNSSRCTPTVCEFGLTSPLVLDRPSAAKTGTTNSFTDNWTVGYTPGIVTGVWVGNADSSPMIGTTGVTGAAPIWHDFMERASKLLNLPPNDFQEPASGVYSGSLCRLPGPYSSYGTGIYDLYAGPVPYCSVGTSSTTLPVPQASTPYQPPAAVQPQAQQPQVAAPPTAIPAVPTQAPVIQPTQPVSGVQPGVQPQPAPAAPQAPVNPAPTVAAPVQSPPAQAPPAQSPPANTAPGNTTAPGSPVP